MNRMNVLYLVLATVAGAAAGAWFVGSQISSPAEVAARTAAPTASPILVPIERRVLSTDVVTRGTVRFGLPQPISIVPSALKPAPGLIATVPLLNARFAEGDVIATASGRPIFLFQGPSPTYRDLAPNVHGEDVRQLKQALQRLGVYSGSIDDMYDHQTSDAVAAWYKKKGWEPFGPTRDQIAALKTIEREWSDAVRARIAAESGVTTAAQAVTAARAAAYQGNQAAALERATRSDDRRRLEEMRESGKPPLTLESEKARAMHAESAAAADIAVQTAEQALIALDPRQSETARNAANAKLEMAKAARRKAQLESEIAMQTAEREVALATDRIRLADAATAAAAREGERAVRAAQEAQKLAEYDLKLATQRAEQATAEYDLAKKRLGVQIPADEIVFLPSLPVRVQEISAAVGAPATGTVMSVTDFRLAVDSGLPIDTAQLVKPGMKVSIDEPALGIKTTGVVAMVAASPGTRGVDGFHFYFETRVDDTPLQLDRVSVRLTIPIKSTQGEVTAVPVSALSLSVDGVSRVQIDNNGVLEYVTVKPGLSAGGFVEIIPVEGKLVPGQLVVVGYKNVEQGS